MNENLNTTVKDRFDRTTANVKDRFGRAKESVKTQFDYTKESVQTHFEENHDVYKGVAIGGSIVASIAGAFVGGAYFGQTRAGQIVIQKAFLAYKSPMTQTVIQQVARRGNPGIVIQRTSDACQWASKNSAAQSIGCTVKTLNKHLNGELPNVLGETYRILGEAGHVGEAIRPL